MPIETITITDTGCYLDNHRGHYISRDVIDLACGYGFIIGPCERYVVDAYDDHLHEADYPFESIVELCDEAIAWLNNGRDSRMPGQNYPPIIPDNAVWEFNDGDFGLYTFDDDERGLTIMPTEITAEIGTTGQTETITLTGDPRADIASAVELEHPCDDTSTCDVVRALEDGYPLWAAHLLQGATECPLVDAVVGHYAGTDALPDVYATARTECDEWLTTDTWTHARICLDCNGYTFDAPDECGHCGSTDVRPRADGFDVNAFVDGYIECALWADCMPADRCVECDALVEYEASLDAWQHVNQSADDDCALDRSPRRDDNAEIGGGQDLELRPGARERMASDCYAFIADNLADLREYAATCTFDPSYAGHDFWLTRRGHGAGFWDRGLGALGDRLSEAARTYGKPDDHTPYDCGDGTADV